MGCVAGRIADVADTVPARTVEIARRRRTTGSGFQVEEDTQICRLSTLRGVVSGRWSIWVVREVP